MDKKFNRKDISDFSVPIKFHIHILKHFSQIDSKYEKWLSQESKIPFKEIKDYLKSTNTSKFETTFVSSPTDLINVIRIKFIKSYRNSIDFYNNRLEIQFVFRKREYKNGIGIDNIIRKGSKVTSGRSTWLLNVILFINNGQIEIITAFPGKYAPALPSSNQTRNEYDKSMKFWNDYILL